jgi:hypothetical protein
MALKTLFSVALMGAVSSCWTSDGSAVEVSLPEGRAPAALAAQHFPDRVHEFVWRNWNLVEPAMLAKVVGASVQDITTIAESMGLPPAADIPKEQNSRGYITLIRRNWHLLPYDQLLEILGMTPDQLDFALREDDFLWSKLGSLKPKCERLRYAAPDEAARRRAAEIKRVVEEEFGEEIRRPGEPRFHFLKQLSTPAVSSSSPASPVSGDDQQLSLRFIYSYFAVYGDPLLNPELDPYPDGLLQRLSALGINGVWLHVVLRDLAPGGTTFPEFGAGHERRLASLRALVERAKKYGIDVYLYMNEPRAMPNAFFMVEGRAEMAGVRGVDLTALCTSHPAVRQWMRDALAHVFREVPGLGGVFTITASENLTNCAAHGGRELCPHCKNRTDAEVIADANVLIEEGVHRGNPQAKVIVWDWQWPGKTSEIISRLPKSVWLMSVSEWSLPLDRGGVPMKVNEYSVSAVGPGPRATEHWRLAQEAGLKTVAKVQLNNSWELSTVPYLPVMDLVARHCHNLALAGLDGMMLSWSLGGYPSPSLEIAARFRDKPVPSTEEVLDAAAVERYGAEGAPLARKAWSTFSAAFQEYPYGQIVLYFCPVHVGPANPLYLVKTGYSATMTGIPYDDVARWCEPYPVEVFASQFEKVAEKWRSGIPDLQAAVEKAPPERRAEAESELRFARAAAIHFQSVANQTRFILARNALADSSKTLSADERQRLLGEIRSSLRSEIALARELFTLAQEDSRIGFEAANQYFFVPLDLAEKVVNCRWLLRQFQE